MPSPKRPFLRGSSKTKANPQNAEDSAKRERDNAAPGSTGDSPLKRGASKPVPPPVEVVTLPPDTDIIHEPSAAPSDSEAVEPLPAPDAVAEAQPSAASATVDEPPLSVTPAAVDEVQPPPVASVTAEEAQPSAAAAAMNEVSAPPAPPLPTDLAGARAYQVELQRLMTTLAEDFSLGKINRPQFEAVYAHYREQRHIMDALINSMRTESWRMAIDTELTGKLLERNAAQLVSHALYDNATSQMLAASARFKINPGFVAPFIAVYRQVSHPKPAISTSKIAGGQWVCLVSARHTTLVAVFSLEPAHAQLQLLQDLHRDFELANANRLSRGEGRAAAEQFIQLWALDKMV